MPDSEGTGAGAGAGDQNPDRPSFTDYWKQSKDKQAAQNLTIVSSKLGQPAADGKDEAQEEPTAESKALERRQQVRKAQRQHRQRKANYTKQLEKDITKLRDDIAKVEEEAQRLRDLNDAIQAQLNSSGGGGNGGGGGQQGGHMMPPSGQMLPQQLPEFNATDMGFSTFFAPNYTVSLDMSANLGAPAYQVRRASPPMAGMGMGTPAGSGMDTSSTGDTAANTFSSAPSVAGSWSMTAASSTPCSTLEEVAIMEANLSEQQIDLAINFILALEHCCWNHIDQHLYDHSHPHPRLSDVSHSHHLGMGTGMGTGMGMGMGMNMSMGMGATDDEEAEAEAEDEAALSGHTFMATALALQNAPMTVFSRMSDSYSSAPAQPQPQTSPIEWQSRTLTLTNLRRLARSLNPSDSELAPVQVWFELVSLYGVEVATDADLLRRLNKELSAFLDCDFFGASLQRTAFESVLERVVGFLPRQWGVGGCIGEGGEEDMLGFGGGGGGGGERAEEGGSQMREGGMGVHRETGTDELGNRKSTDSRSDEPFLPG
ncbi:hypothetical protein F4808DRAFT_170624 [Astrocystis sublimbata]|nr:hypothetical protein F4808DRAFT_170624 [Astrocystis sublimbata]